MRAVTLLLAVFLIVSFYSPAFSQDNTIKREIDPIIIQGSSLTDLNGVEISRLRVFAQNNGAMKSIPFQVDERNAKGRYVMTGGKKAGKDEDGGKLDKNDELIFISRDLGGKAKKESWPKGFTKGIEVTVTDPVNGAKGFAYILAFDKPPPPCSTDYVRFDPNSQKVYGRTYIVGFDRKRPLREIYFASPVDKKNVNDTFKLRMVITIKLGGIKVKKTQSDFKSKLEGYIDGPVRVTRRMSSSMLILRLPTPKLETDSFFWPDFNEVPADVKVPFNISKVVKSFTFITSIDHNENAYGAIFYNSNNRKGVKIDGVMSGDEKNMDLSPPKWGVIKYKNVAPFQRVVFGKTLQNVKPFQYYVDDNNAEDKPDEKPGQIGNMGVNMMGLEKLKKGTHKFTAYTYYLKTYKPGDEKWILNIEDKPLKVSVGKLRSKK